MFFIACAVVHYAAIEDKPCVLKSGIRLLFGSVMCLPSPGMYRCIYIVRTWVCY